MLLYSCKSQSNDDCFGVYLGNVPKLFVTTTNLSKCLIKCFEQLMIYDFCSKNPNIVFFYFDMFLCQNSEIILKKLRFPHGGK